ncbi:prolipoprotein diacylglyceryl transferase [Mycoplasma zalophi]|uniref:Phosphatidylglycerol--prolipoprotein diacylglyceryl transferase n=1 Tax=Mycoplasma zalophi TaxID=191287 RepID=A0ABS6DQB5_9MOLU|nr:prolipoprotein diacylglyceryl transferase [Mycoplasma zalophi]MBU4692521.1 prolipoprotein diacylglyceryl transferase [Mycoplasma zalophi]
MEAFLEKTIQAFSGYIPDDPDTVLKLGNIRLYSLLMMLGMFCAILTVYYFWRREKYPFEIFATVVIITLPSAIVGARLFFIFERMAWGDWIYLKSNWYKVWTGGLSIQGGVVTATIADIIFLSFFRHKIDIKKCFSIILPAVFIGQAIGRWGNFSNHELFGKAISADDLSIVWLPDIIKKQMFINYNGISSYRVPLFIYESIANLIGYITLVWILNKYNWLRPGTTGGLYWIFYGIIRISMENLRQDHYTFYNVFSSLYIIFGITMVLYFELSINKRYTIYLVEPSKSPKWNKLLHFYVWEDSELYTLRKLKEKQRKELLKSKAA